MSRPDIETVERIVSDHENEGSVTTICEIAVIRALLDYVAELEGKQQDIKQMIARNAAGLPVVEIADTPTNPESE